MSRNDEALSRSGYEQHELIDPEGLLRAAAVAASGGGLVLTPSLEKVGAAAAARCAGRPRLYLAKPLCRRPLAERSGSSARPTSRSPWPYVELFTLHAERYLGY